MGVEKQQGSFTARHTPWQHISFKDIPAPRSTNALPHSIPPVLSCAFSMLQPARSSQEVLPSSSSSDGQMHRQPVKHPNWVLHTLLSPLLLDLPHLSLQQELPYEHPQSNIPPIHRQELGKAPLGAQLPACSQRRQKMFCFVSSSHWAFMKAEK